MNDKNDKSYMKGFYSIWTAPYHLKHKCDFSMHDYELLVMILSCLKWQEHSGACKLIADKDSLAYIDKLGLSDIFNDGVQELVVDKDINPKVFWAAGKLYALRQMKEKSAMIDLDLIVWQSLEKEIKGSDIYGIHREELRPEVYPELSFFRLKEGSLEDKGYDQETLPLNTAFLYIDDLDFQHKYADEAIELMRFCAEENENLKHMVFAEQRLLPIMASKYNKGIKTMFPLGQDIGYQEYFTHIWGHKNILKYNRSERIHFNKRIMDRIKQDFPAFYEDKTFQLLFDTETGGLRT